ncbi:hypothetical protein BJ508DRAFT_328418 [Ascobolus immersus RN42]|uniref:Chitin-binding type-1 domain-containing protein n=1 Tax=Ascobolus immersus RN42 TaxID=1160509 RepID=A0A3N4ICB2_ASCIM|nr:hypothetical protein BJ508DRAFT_328418 [Ascobolus immersus RN42]
MGFFSLFNLVFLLPLLLILSLAFGALPVDAVLTKFPTLLEAVAALSPAFKEKLDKVKAARESRQDGRDAFIIDVQGFFNRLSGFLKHRLRILILSLIDEDIQSIVTSSIELSVDAHQQTIAKQNDDEESVSVVVERLEQDLAASIDLTKKFGLDLAELSLELANIDKRITSLFDSQARLTKGVNGGYYEVERVKKAVKVVEDVMNMVVEEINWKVKGLGLKARSGVRSLTKYLEEEEDDEVKPGDYNGVRLDEEDIGRDHPRRSRLVITVVVMTSTSLSLRIVLSVLTALLCLNLRLANADHGTGPSAPKACGHFDQYGGMGANNIWVTQDDGELFCPDDECCSGFGWCGNSLWHCMDCDFYHSGANSPCTPDFDPTMNFHVFLVLIDTTGKKWVQYPNGTIVDYEDQMQFWGAIGNFNMNRWDLDDDELDMYSGLPDQPLPRNWDPSNAIDPRADFTGFDYVFPEFWGNWDQFRPPNDEENIADFFPTWYYVDDVLSRGREWDVHFVDEEVIVQVPPDGPYTLPIYEDPPKPSSKSSYSWGTSSSPAIFNPGTIWPQQTMDIFFQPEIRRGKADDAGWGRPVRAKHNDPVIWKTPLRRPPVYRSRGLQSVFPLLRAAHAIVPVTLEWEDEDATSTDKAHPAKATVSMDETGPDDGIRLPFSEIEGGETDVDTDLLPLQNVAPATSSTPSGKRRHRHHSITKTGPDASIITPATADPVIRPRQNTVIIKRSSSSPPIDVNDLALNPDGSLRIKQKKKRDLVELTGLQMLDVDLHDPKYKGKVYQKKLPRSFPVERFGLQDGYVPKLLTNRKIENPTPTTLEWGAVITPAGAYYFGGVNELKEAEMLRRRRK